MGAALPIISIATTVGGKLFAGFAARRAAEAEASDIRGQAALEREENLEEAKRLKREGQRFLAKQSLMFVKGGVSLEGSPLLVLEETREETEKQFRAGIKQAEARFGFGRKKAARVSAFGRTKFLSGLFGAAASGFSLTSKARELGVFSKKGTP